MKKVKFSVTMALMLSVSLVGTSAVQATEVTATVVAPVGGTRTLSPVPVVVAPLSAANNFSATLTVSAVEAAIEGDSNGWSVTAISGDFTTTGTVIAASNFAYARTSETKLLPDGPTSGTLVAGQNGALSATKTLFSVTGETAGTVPGYSETYTSVGTVTLTLPAGTPAGVYTATVTITLMA